MILSMWPCNSCHMLTLWTVIHDWSQCKRFAQFISIDMMILIWSYQYDHINMIWSGAWWLFEQPFKTDAQATYLFNLCGLFWSYHCNNINMMIKNINMIWKNINMTWKNIDMICSNMWRLARVDCKIFTKRRERISKNRGGNPEWAKPTRDCPRGFWILSRVFEWILSYPPS